MFVCLVTASSGFVLSSAHVPPLTKTFSFKSFKQLRHIRAGHILRRGLKESGERGWWWERFVCDWVSYIWMKEREGGRERERGSEVGVQLPKWRVTLHFYVWQCTYKCGEKVAHATSSPNIGWTLEFRLWNANTQQQRQRHSDRQLDRDRQRERKNGRCKRCKSVCTWPMTFTKGKTIDTKCTDLNHSRIFASVKSS